MIEIGNLEHGLAITREAKTLFDVHHDIVISRTKDDRLMGGVVYTNFTLESISMHLAGFHTHWISRDLAWLVMHYAFVQLGCSSIFAMIRSRNHKAIDFTSNFGFKCVTTIPGMFPEGEAALVYQLHKRDAERWLRLTPKTITSGGN